MLLIVDLDDTIFPVKSISPEVVEPAISIIRNELGTTLSKEEVSAIVNELWKRPFDVVAKRYKFSDTLVTAFYQKINALVFEFKIQTYPDYKYLLNINVPKILVTTGFENLQRAKIKHLGIAEDFQELFIDDPTSLTRLGKKEIFKNIQIDKQMAPEDIWIIGDSESSEIKAGLELAYKTIRVIRTDEHSTKAEHAIRSFKELPAILFRS